MRTSKLSVMTASLRRRRRTHHGLSSGSLGRVRPRLETMEDRTMLSAFQVTNTGDGGPGSLRQAILDVNSIGGTDDRIDFAIAGAGVHTIYPASALPPILDSVLIDGWSQHGFAGQPLIELSGSEAGDTDGFLIFAPNVTIRGLNINSFSYEAGIEVNGTANARIQGNYLGTDPTGTLPRPNGTGILINSGGNNLVGGAVPGEGNLIASNAIAGVKEQNYTANNQIIGNRIFGNSQLNPNHNAVFESTPYSSVVALPNNLIRQFEQNATIEARFQTKGGGVILGYQDVPFDPYSFGNWIASDPAIYVGTDGLLHAALPGSPDELVSPSPVNDGQWHHAALVLDGAQASASFYLDSQRIGSLPISVVDFGGYFNQIGTGLMESRSAPYDGWYQFQGRIADVRIWSVPRSASQISQDATMSPNITDPGLEADYPLDEGKGLIAHDLTLNHRDGALTGNYYDPESVWLRIGRAIALDPTVSGVQNSPTIIVAVDGRLKGWLRQSLPNAPIHIEFFASAAHGSGMEGQAEDFLGSLEVTTDDQGQVVFDVPFAPPGSLPLMTATATGPAGNTSEVSAFRQVSLRTPAPGLVVVPGQPVAISATVAAIGLEDPDAGLLDPAWDVSLMVPVGTLSLSSLIGLTGTGNGTGTISYRGALSQIDAALAGLVYTAPQEFRGTTTLTILAASPGAPALQAVIRVTDGHFLVTNTADNGPGSLRQAILDADTTPQGATISFAIPGSGVHTILPFSPLPAITTSVLIDGFSQGGYAGIPLIEINGQKSGTGDGLTITGSGTTIRGLAIDGFASGAGVVIQGPAATGNSVTANVIGTDPSGASIRPTQVGVRILGGAHGNTVGGLVAGAGNRITSNLGSGVIVAGADSIDNAIIGNSITAVGTGGLTFNTGLAYVQLPSFTLGGSLTIETWVRSYSFSSAFGTVFDLGDGPGSNNIRLAWLAQNGLMEFEVVDSGGVAHSILSSTTFPTGVWVHVAAVIDDQGNGAIYWNGQQVAAGPLALPLVEARSNQYLGHDNNSSAFAFYGALDQVKIWSGSRTAGQILDDMTAVPVRSEPGLLAYYPVSDDQGSIVHDEGPDGLDANLAPYGGDLSPWNTISAQAIDLGADGGTYNSATPRGDANHLQNFPIIVTLPDGRLQGWLGGCAPETLFHLEFFASRSYAGDGAGEAQEFLGSLNVMTDDQGSVVFDVPFAAPVGMPIVTATATDPAGNTSEASAQRRAALQSPIGWVRLNAGQPLFPSGSSSSLILQDPDAGPLDPSWNFTVSVPAGTLSLPSLDGLTGTGNGTGRLTYSGSLRALDVALAELIYTAPLDFPGTTVLTISATSSGASSIEAAITISDGHFSVTTTADTGPGSLRQSIIDANTVLGTSTIDFAIPGPGVQRISPGSPLPAITNSVLVDGFSQPGYDGTPLIEIDGEDAGTGDGLTITGSGATIRGLAIDGFESGAGVVIQGPAATGNTITANVIGADPTGASIRPTEVGIRVIDGARDNTVGGLAAGAGNRIVGVTGPGVVVGGADSVDNEILGNTVSALAQAIDLGDDGVTYDSAAPRIGANNLQNYPIIVTLGDGRLQGWLGQSIPQTRYHIEFFASSSFAADGAGEAREFLGSLSVTTDDQGTAVFDVPFAPPVGMPIVTATATDPEGSTSEASAQRRPALQSPSEWIRVAPGQPLFPSASSHSLILEDPDAGPLDPSWELTLSVPAGTLELGGLDGLMGSGNGTATLQYRGSLSAVNAALSALTYTLPLGSHGSVLLTVSAAAVGAASVEAQATLTDGIFSVTSTADSGAGSLRQAILDANRVVGGSTIDFAIPGSGVQHIAPESPLPVIATPVFVDGYSQPGYDRAPLIEIDGELAPVRDGLTITGSGSTIRGLAITGFAGGAAILIEGLGAGHNWIYGNQLGQSAGSLAARANRYGVEVINGAHDNVIGSHDNDTNSAGDGNQIGGNAVAGVILTEASVLASPGFGGPADDLTLNGSASLVGSRLRLTDDSVYEMASVFTSQPVDVRRFQTQFTFQLANPTGGGLTFTIQAQGPTALGSSLGWGIDSSVAVVFNAGMLESLATDTNFISCSLAGTGIDLSSGDVFRAGLSYDGDALSVTITDTATGAEATRVYSSVDIPGTVGGPVAYVGFTAESGSSNGSSETSSNVLDWSYTSSAAVAGNRVAGNVITNNGGPGILVFGDDSTGNTIVANSIFDNAGPAIDEVRDGSSGLSRSPVMVVTARGALEGWLRAGLPDASYHVDFYASAGYAADGSGEGHAYLGSLDVMTDGQGNASFESPFNPPDGLPIVTATVTDPLGSTSEISGLRAGNILAPETGFRKSPGQPLPLSAGSGAGLSLQDPAAGPLAATWSLTISVPVGALSLLPGAGSAAGSLQVQGTLSVINAFLAHLILTLPAGFHGNTALCVTAESAGAVPIRSSINITDGIFVVSTVADSGPGSLRQAILDSNSAGGRNTISFALPGAGVRTIALTSPLPQATAPTLIDGSTQPGFAGSPLVAVAGQWAGANGGFDAAGSSLAVRSLAVDAYAFGTGGVPADVIIESAPMLTSASGYPKIDRYTIDTAADGRLQAQVLAHGLTTRLSLRDSHGNMVVQSDGQAPRGTGPLIDQHLPAGTYELTVEIIAGAGNYELDAKVTPTSSAFQLNTSQTLQQVVADFNGDGIPDVSLADGVHLGIGDGTFRSPLAPLGVPAGDYCGPAVAGDFNGDDKLDLAVADLSNGTVSLIMGNGDGTFQSTTLYVAGEFYFASFASLVTGDFNGDGKLDLAVDRWFDPTLSVVLGRGDGTFQPPQVYQLRYGTEAKALVAQDLNGDGKLDLAVADYEGAIDVLLGHGDGTFGVGPFHQPLVTAASVYIEALVAGDLNGDGKLDLAASSSDTVNIQILLGNGDGTFESAALNPVGFTGTAIQLGDFTGDGKPDLMYWGGSARFGDDAFIWILAGNGDGTFQAPRSIPHRGSALKVFSVLTGDFNGDGKVDLIETDDQPKSLGVLLGNGDGTFQVAGESTDTFPSTAAAGDFNGDGMTDMALASLSLESITILLGNGQGGFRVGQSISLGPGFISGTPVVADYNGDGRLDMAMIRDNADYRSRDLLVLLGNGDGTFQTTTHAVPGVVLPPDESPILSPQLASGDFNGDGRPDLLTLGDDGSSLLFISHGDGTFSARISEHDSGYRPVVFVVGDFDGDGNLDIATDDELGPYGTGIAVYRGDGAGGFARSPAAHPVGATVDGGLVVGDFNGDGKLDLATLDDSFYGPASISIFLGRGDATFDPAISDSPPLTNTLIAADFDGDGKLDLAGQGVSILILHGNGDGTFQSQAISPERLIAFDALCVADLNGDGRLDLILPDELNGTVTTLLNRGDGTFSSGGQVVTGSQDTPVVADVNNDGTGDVFMVAGNGKILYRQGNPEAPGSFQPPVSINPGFPSRDAAWVAGTLEGPLLASVDAQDDAVSLYAYRNGGFVRVGSLATGRLPTQIIAADLNHDGRDDLVVRSAGDGTLSVFLNEGQGHGVASNLALFSPAVSISVGPGASSVQAIDTAGTGSPDLVVTNAAAGQVSILLNSGDGTFAPAKSYRAGVSLSGFNADPGSDLITSHESTLAVVGGSLANGSPVSLITANPGSGTLDLLEAVPGGGFANPIVMLGSITAHVIRSADFNHDGIMDLAVLESQGLSVRLGDGKGGLLPPAIYDAGHEPTALAIADADGDGQSDLLIGNPYGDVLVLLSKGNGTFLPYRKTDQSVALAVADLTGNGSKDVIYADQGLDRVVVDYGGGNTTVLGDRSSGLLSPGAVRLADLNGDGVPDLVVANTGSNNVLVYPGLGTGQFGPAANGGHGFFTGTNPTGMEVADLNGDTIPDLLVANSGSNDVSILLGQGTGSNWIVTPGPRIKSAAGPVAVAVGNFLGTGHLDLAVANQQANNVQVFPGVGNGFFNDTAPLTYPVGQAPSGLFMGNFTGSGMSIATLNSGSSTISLISPGGVIQTINAGGVRPVSGFAGDFTGNGFTDLVVGNNGDGRFALFTGGPGALSVSQTVTSAEVPSPTSLSFAGVSDGILSFYASTAGRETASLLAFNLNPEESSSEGGPVGGGGLTTGSEQPTGPVLTSATAGVFDQVAMLLNLNGSALDLVAPLFTVSVIGGEFEVESTAAGGVALLANFTPGAGSATLGQALGVSDISTEGEAAENTGSAVEEAGSGTVPTVTTLPIWDGMAMGLEKAWKQVRIYVLEKGGVSEEAADRAVSGTSHTNPVTPDRMLSPDGPDSQLQGTPRPTRSNAGLAPTTTRPEESSESRKPASLGVLDAATADLVAENESKRGDPRSPTRWLDELAAIHHDRLAGPIAAAIAVGSATTILACVKSGRFRRGSGRKVRSQLRWRTDDHSSAES